MKGLFRTCFFLLFFLQGGYNEEEKYGYFNIDFKISSDELPHFFQAKPIVFENRGCFEKKATCKLTLELCFIGQKPGYYGEHNFDSCERADSTIKSYTLIVNKTESGEIKTEKCTLDPSAEINKNLREHARGNEIHVYAKLIFPTDDKQKQVYFDINWNHKLEGNLEADYPHSVNVHFTTGHFNESGDERSKYTRLWVRGTLQLMCEENWYGCWCDQFCYKNATHYNCGDFGKKICKKGFFPERGDLDLCREKDPSTSLCQNYCLFEDDEDDINQKLKVLKEKESCDPCGFKTCNYPTAYKLNGTTNTCDKRTCTWPRTITCHYSESECIDILTEKEEYKDAGTNAFFKCTCKENEITARLFKNNPYHYYCVAKLAKSGEVTELLEIL